MYELALFAGAGGGILGGLLCGFRTVCAVENDPYARDVLVSRQNDGCLQPFPIWDDVRTFDGRPWRGRVDIISGGFPCQDISPAGKGAGIEGSRSGLWKEMARIIREVGPRFVLVENSSALVGRGMGTVCGDLAQMGYDERWGVLGAADAGAPHQRDRIWILSHAHRRGAYPKSKHLPRSPRPANLDRDGALQSLAHAVRDGAAKKSGDMASQAGSSQIPAWRGQRPQPGHRRESLADSAQQYRPGYVETPPEPGRSRENVADIHHPHSQGCGDAEACDAGESQQPEGQRNLRPSPCAGWWHTEPGVGRVADGVAARVDRLRCLGNGQVPAVVRLAWHTLNQA